MDDKLEPETADELNKFIDLIRSLTPEELRKMRELVRTGEIPESDREAFEGWVRDHKVKP